MTAHRRSLGSVVTLLALALVIGGCGESEEIAQLGAPPTREWPLEAPCPESLSGECDGKTLALVSTVNEPRETVVNASFFGADAHVVCRRPPGASGSCALIGQRGATVRGEAAVYAILDD
jgi:hypothetical protein